MRKFIYVAGPYTNGDVALNVKTAIHEGDYIARLGHVPYVPHFSHFWHMMIPHDYEFWMDIDFAWISKCDALYRIKGESSGADREVELAKKLGIEVYTSIFDIPRAEAE